MITSNIDLDRIAYEVRTTFSQVAIRCIGLRPLLLAVALAVAFALVVAHAATGEPKLLGLAVFAVLALIVAWGIQE